MESGEREAEKGRERRGNQMTFKVFPVTENLVITIEDNGLKQQGTSKAPRNTSPNHSIIKSGANSRGHFLQLPCPWAALSHREFITHTGIFTGTSWNFYRAAARGGGWLCGGRWREELSRGGTQAGETIPSAPPSASGSITVYRCSLCARRRESRESFSQLEAVKQV